MKKKLSKEQKVRVEKWVAMNGTIPDDFKKKYKLSFTYQENSKNG